MNALQKIKEGVTDGVKAIEEKVAALESERAEEKALKEQIRAENAQERERVKDEKAKEKERQQKALERAKARKRFSRTVRRTIAGLLAGIIILATGAWYTLSGLGVPVPSCPVQPLWAAGLMAVGVAAMITGKGIPIKFGLMLLGVLVLIRDNQWLWGVLGSISIWKLIAAVGIIVIIMYVTIVIVRLRSGTLRSIRKAKKAIEQKKKSVREKLSETRDKLKNIGGNKK